MPPASEPTLAQPGPGLAQLGLPRRVAVITGLLAILLVVGTTELALSLAERSRLQDLRQESIELGVTLAAYLGRIAPTGEPSALAVGLGGWSRRHLTRTTAVVYVVQRDSLVQAAASEGAVTRPASALDLEALRALAPAVQFRNDSTPAWEVAVPLGRHRPYGVLEVRVYTGRLDQWARMERRRSYALALGSALLLSVGVWLLFTRWVGIPLRELTRAMAGAHSGAEGSPAALEIGPPEFRHLARRYNDLREALARRERESEARAGLLTLEERARSYDRLAQAEEISRGFAHEIGTPLNTMGGHLQLLREDLRRSSDLPGQDRVSLLLGQLDRVATIVRDGLRRSTWPTPRLRAVALGELAGQVVEFLEPSLDEAEVSVKLTGDRGPVLQTDPDLVEQILLNLLKNAVDVLAPGGLIELATGSEDGQAFIEVSDDGPGLPPEMQTRLFQPFATSKGASGTGLGLAVSRRLARTLGGELEFVPTPRGTRWRLTLPMPER